MNRKTFVTCWVALAGLAVASIANPPNRDSTETQVDRPYDPTDHYTSRTIEGWPVRINRRLDEPGTVALRDATLKLLANHLYRVARVVPEPALAKLRAIPIWVERDDPHHPCMCYHPSADWLSDNGMNPDKAGGVEIANARNFLAWTLDQPWMVLHELAHGYHHQVLGFEHPEVRRLFEKAVSAKTYEAVLRIGGRTERAYALNNPREYFAESSEAFFGTNDFYPFVRAELKRHDPDMHEWLAKLWGVDAPRGKRSDVAPPQHD